MGNSDEDFEEHVAAVIMEAGQGNKSWIPKFPWSELQSWAGKRNLR